MEKGWLFLSFSFLLIFVAEATLEFEGSASINFGGENTPNQESPSFNALQAWKSAITDDPSGILRTWVGPKVCTYKGIFCVEHNETGAAPGPVVKAIDLNHANLQGSLVDELCLLKNLTIFHLNTNRFSGTIPDTFIKLSNLEELDLSNNKFSGPFPQVALQMPCLIYLDIRYNDFSGQIPEEIFRNDKIDALFVNNNKFEGELPLAMARSCASVINLANNMFSGSIPFGLSFNGSKLKEILFHNNKLTGCIPHGIGFFSNLEVFDVSNNDMMGQLPNALACLTKIEVMNLSHNKFSGVLPDVLCHLNSLLNLSVSYNFFSGFNDECKKMPFWNRGFDFADNCIPGRDLQRADCSAIPGADLNCLKMPSYQLPVCGK